MKKSLLALAVLGTFAGAAAAQSSVTLFGVVDLSLKYVENGNTEMKQLGSDGIQSSRFGVRGVEDLGGGLRAGFHLESGLDAGTGATTGSTLWQRRATVSLLGGFGEIRLGRDLNPIFLTHATYDPFGTVGVGTSFNVVSGLGSGVGTLVRTSNMAAYLTPTTIPFYAHLGISPSEGCQGLPPANTVNCAGGNTQKFTGGRVGFGAGPFDISIGASKTEITDVLDYEQRAIGGSFDFGFLKLFAYYMKNKFDPREQDVWQVAATVPLGQGLFKFSWADSNMKGGAGVLAPFRDVDDARIVSLQYVYNLSKRTGLYATYADLKNDGASAFVVGPTAQAPTPAAGFKSKGYEFGVRHAF